MKLNLAIIDGMIKDEPLEKKFTNETVFNIKRCHIFSSDTAELLEDTLYIVEKLNISVFLDLQPSMPFAIIGPPENMEQLSIYQNWIVYSKDITAQHLFISINNILEYFFDWKERIYCGIMQGNSPQEILNICSEPFVNPIAIFDVYSVLLASAGVFKRNMDVIWELVSKEGYFPLERYQMLNEQEVYESHKPIVTRIPNLQVSLAAIPLEYNKNIFATICATNNNEDFSIGQLSLFIVLKRILEKTNFLQNQVLSTNKGSFVLERMLRGKITEESTVAYFLKRWRHQSEDTFCLYYLFSAGNGLFSDKAIETVIQRLARRIKDRIICSFENGIVMLSTAPLSEREKTDLQLILSKYKLCCAVSVPFSPFSYLHYAYLQCCSVMAIIQNSMSEKIIYFQDQYENFIFHTLSNVTDLRTLCDSRLLAFSQKRNGKTFIHSLKCYLINGRNISDAANKLYLHRNTLIYRIEQMEKLLNVDFHSISDYELFQIYFSCMIIEYF